MKNLVTLLGQTVEKQHSYKLLVDNGFKPMEVAVNAFIGSINDRWSEQTVTIPADKKGNLKEFAGKQVIVIPTTIKANGGARINFYIKAV